MIPPVLAYRQVRPDARAPLLRYRVAAAAESYTFIAAAFAFAVALLIYPVVYTVLLSFRAATMDTFVAGTMRLAGLDNYAAALRDSVFWLTVRNTLLFVVLSIVFQFGLGLLIALYFMARFPLKRVLLSLLLVPWLLPSIATANVFRFFFEQGGLANATLRWIGLPTVYWLSDARMALVATIVTNIWVGVPFNFVLLYGGLRAIPHDVYEAAAIDGATPARQFVHITVPLLKPVALTVLMLGTIYTFKVFDLVWLMTAGGPANASHLLSTYTYQEGFVVFNFGKAAASASLMLLMTMALTGVYLVLGRERGAP